MFKLVIQDDEGKTTVVPLIRDEITIGRKEGNTIRLTERNVSRRHARILRNNGEVHIEDLNSYNGIRVNNARIAERVSLRISDQVQIGDYKLYLKAEGVEQVDDARTMPIERIDQGLPTEVMAAVASTPAPAAAPPAVQAPPIIPPAPIPGTPAPNRGPAAVADTDPSGRPVATAAQVAALTAPAGYGRLVIVSSNFAGKEFELTRPQMIVGRTDENDIVVNHRSISRNHAKVTRDPESGRYTISDLQSSNGVRVNGQDYGKVELRRNDTVDLGHVRFQFVEPGQDFVFARDAVIADISDGGGKKGLVVALVLGVLVLGGVGAFFALGGKKEDPNNSAGKGSGTNGQVGPGSDVVANNNNPGSDDTPGSAAVGSNPDTTPQVVKPDDAAGQIKVECGQLALEKKWSDAMRCADRLAALDKDAAKALKANYALETANDISLDKVGDALRLKNYAGAKKELANIEDTSVYRADAEAAIKTYEDTMTELYHASATALKARNKCGDIDKLVNEAREKGGEGAADAVAKQKCTTTAGNTGGNTGGNTTVVAEKPDCSKKLVDGSTACKNEFCNANPDHAKCSSGQTQVVAPANCDADVAKDKGMNHINSGQHAAALAQFEASLRCKDDPYVRQLAFMEACASGNSSKAKVYYKKLTPAQQTKFAQICIRQKPPVAYE